DRDESLQLSKRFVVDAISYPRSVLTTANQPGVLQDSEVLRNRRLREGQLVDDLAAYPCLLQRQHAKDANASWMADCLRQFGQFIIGVWTLKTLKGCLCPRFGRWATEGI